MIIAQRTRTLQSIMTDPPADLPALFRAGLLQTSLSPYASSMQNNPPRLIRMSATVVVEPPAPTSQLPVDSLGLRPTSESGVLSALSDVNALRLALSSSLNISMQALQAIITVPIGAPQSPPSLPPPAQPSPPPSPPPLPPPWAYDEDLRMIEEISTVANGILVASLSTAVLVQFGTIIADALGWVSPLAGAIVAPSAGGCITSILLAAQRFTFSFDSAVFVSSVQLGVADDLSWLCGEISFLGSGRQTPYNSVDLSHQAPPGDAPVSSLRRLLRSLPHHEELDALSPELRTLLNLLITFALAVILTYVLYGTLLLLWRYVVNGPFYKWRKLAYGTFQVPSTAVNHIIQVGNKRVVVSYQAYTVEVTKDIGQRIGADLILGEHGIVVFALAPDSVLRRHDVEVGDEILSINDHSLNPRAEFNIDGDVLGPVEMFAKLAKISDSLELRIRSAKKSTDRPEWKESTTPNFYPFPKSLVWPAPLIFTCCMFATGLTRASFKVLTNTGALGCNNNCAGGVFVALFTILLLVALVALGIMDLDRFCKGEYKYDERIRWKPSPMASRPSHVLDPYYRWIAELRLKMACAQMVGSDRLGRYLPRRTSPPKTSRISTISSVVANVGMRVGKSAAVKYLVRPPEVREEKRQQRKIHMEKKLEKKLEASTYTINLTKQVGERLGAKFIVGSHGIILQSVAPDSLLEGLTLVKIGDEVLSINGNALNPDAEYELNGRAVGPVEMFAKLAQISSSVELRILRRRRTEAVSQRATATLDLIAAKWNEKVDAKVKARAEAKRLSVMKRTVKEAEAEAREEARLAAKVEKRRVEVAKAEAAKFAAEAKAQEQAKALWARQEAKRQHALAEAARQEAKRQAARADVEAKARAKIEAQAEAKAAAEAKVAALAVKRSLPTPSEQKKLEKQKKLEEKLMESTYTIKLTKPVGQRLGAELYEGKYGVIVCALAQDSVLIPYGVKVGDEILSVNGNALDPDAEYELNGRAVGPVEMFAKLAQISNSLVLDIRHADPGSPSRAEAEQKRAERTRARVEAAIAKEKLAAEQRAEAARVESEGAIAAASAETGAAVEGLWLQQKAKVEAEAKLQQAEAEAAAAVAAEAAASADHEFAAARAKAAEAAKEKAIAELMAAREKRNLAQYVQAVADGENVKAVQAVADEIDRARSTRDAEKARVLAAAAAEREAAVRAADQQMASALQKHDKAVALASEAAEAWARAEAEANAAEAEMESAVRARLQQVKDKDRAAEAKAAAAVAIAASEAAKARAQQAEQASAAAALEQASAMRAAEEEIERALATRDAAIARAAAAEETVETLKEKTAAVHAADRQMKSALQLRNESSVRASEAAQAFARADAEMKAAEAVAEAAIQAASDAQLVAASKAERAERCRKRAKALAAAATFAATVFKEAQAQAKAINPSRKAPRLVTTPQPTTPSVIRDIYSPAVKRSLARSFDVAPPSPTPSPPESPIDGERQHMSAPVVPIDGVPQRMSAPVVDSIAIVIEDIRSSAASPPIVRDNQVPSPMPSPPPSPSSPHTHEKEESPSVPVEDEKSAPVEGADESVSIDRDDFLPNMNAMDMSPRQIDVVFDEVDTDGIGHADASELLNARALSLSPDSKEVGLFSASIIGSVISSSLGQVTKLPATPPRSGLHRSRSMQQCVDNEGFSTPTGTSLVRLTRSPSAYFGSRERPRSAKAMETMPPERLEALRKEFEQLDANGSGRIDFEEMADKMRELGFDDDEIRARLKKGDLDGDFQLDVDEYIKQVPEPDAVVIDLLRGRGFSEDLVEAGAEKARKLVAKGMSRHGAIAGGTALAELMKFGVTKYADLPEGAGSVLSTDSASLLSLPISHRKKASPPKSRKGSPNKKGAEVPGDTIMESPYSHDDSRSNYEDYDESRDTSDFSSRPASRLTSRPASRQQAPAPALLSVVQTIDASAKLSKQLTQRLQQRKTADAAASRKAPKKSWLRLMRDAHAAATASAIDRLAVRGGFRDRKSGEFGDDLEEDLLEPDRTERLLAEPFAIRRERRGDVFHGRQSYLLFRVNGATPFSTCSRLALVLANMVLGIFAGIRPSLTPSAADGITITCFFLAVQLGVAWACFKWLPDADRLISHAMGFQYLIEAISTIMLLSAATESRIGWHVASGSDLRNMALVVALFAMSMPVLQLLELCCITPLYSVLYARACASGIRVRISTPPTAPSAPVPKRSRVAPAF